MITIYLGGGELGIFFFLGGGLLAFKYPRYNPAPLPTREAGRSIHVKNMRFQKFPDSSGRGPC